MKTNYRGFTINVEREKCLAGHSMLYWTVIREADGWFFEDNFADTEDTAQTITQAMKHRIDDYFLHPEDYEDCPVCDQPHPCECGINDEDDENE
jgi:hypothetical protein